MKSLTVKQFFAQYLDDEACLQHIFDVRFGADHTCSKCEAPRKWYRIKAERAYSCGTCGNHLHPTVGTIFEGSRTSLQSWFYAIYLFTTTRHGVPAKELERQLGVTYKTAWRMGHKIREHMAAVDGDEPLSGDVEVDETFVGGVMPRSEGKALSNKTIVLGMLERDGDVHTQVIPNTSKYTLQNAIKDTVTQGSTIHTDENTSYSGIDSDSHGESYGYEHTTVNHSAGEYVDGNAHVNGIENFWSQLKKGISGTLVHASEKWMVNYAKEFEYRYNSRQAPEKMFSELVTSFPELPES